ncbi:MAG: beta-lactamase family protein [Planctomycetes bacterium]|nr:beta-lactamase family protein [Planctomycetota bacterium]
MMRLLRGLRVLLVGFAVAGEAYGQGRASTIDKTALDALVKRAGELDTDALIVMKDGEVVLEKWFDGEPRRIESMSVTKSIVSMAVGRLLATGKLASLDEPVHTWYPEWRQGRKRRITVRHLLTQSSGLQADPMTGSEIDGSPDVVQLALCAELADEPGTKFFYSNKASNLLAGIVQRAAGRRLDLLMKEEVFAPLGITDVEWMLDAAGNPYAMWGLRIRPADLAKLGQLMLEEGCWKGREILSREWVREAVSPSAVSDFYGHLWWLVKDVARTIDDGVIEEWRKGGVDEKLIAALQPLKGRVFREGFLDAIGKALVDRGGIEAWHESIRRKGLPAGRVIESKVVGFRGDGWQGQQVVVLKEECLVVVRMREPSQGNTAEENERYGFGELTKMARALVRTSE